VHFEASIIQDIVCQKLWLLFPVSSSYRRWNRRHFFERWYISFSTIRPMGYSNV